MLLRVGTIALLNNIAPLDGGVDALTARTVGVAIVAALATTPLDVVKTRMMLGSKNAAGEAYVGTLHSLRTIAVEEGVGALFKGIGPRVGWITIGGCAH